MKRSIYSERRTLQRYDSQHVIAYLNEEVLEDYTPQSSESAAGETAVTPDTGTYYAYSGTEADGGTIIEALLTGRPTAADRDTLINGVIRTRYSQSEEDAIKTHQLLLVTGSATERKQQAYAEEWQAFCAWREEAIAVVDGWIADTPQS
jgi:hypothetical protein